MDQYETQDESARRAVVPLEAPAASPVTTSRTDAVFLAHLIAARLGVPQQRIHRRATMDAASAAYRRSRLA